jgi:hypothetical protein
MVDAIHRLLPGWDSDVQVLGGLEEAWSIYESDG